MPSPLGHALAGFAVHALAAPERSVAGDRVRLAVAVSCAIVPDLDLLLRFVDGRNHHQGASHGVGAALLAGLAVLLVARARGAARPLAWGAVAALGWLSHIALDLLSRDTTPPIGLLALWPFDGRYWKAPWPLFLDIGRTLDWRTVRHNLVAMSWEAVLLGPAAAACWWWGRRRGVRQG
jgi:membrane-bound metal-dependent hydrolase YbcI (DUF457 family)